MKYNKNVDFFCFVNFFASILWRFFYCLTRLTVNLCENKQWYHIWWLVWARNTFYNEQFLRFASSSRFPAAKRVFCLWIGVLFTSIHSKVRNFKYFCSSLQKHVNFNRCKTTSNKKIFIFTMFFSFFSLLLFSSRVCFFDEFKMPPSQSASLPVEAPEE